MIKYEEYTLENGLRVIIHEDRFTPMVAVNVLYDVGSRDEDPQQTGFAHLFEHLMFSGSLNAPNFDDIVQQAGGENNAYTNNDYTNFYTVLPAINLDTGLWIEADRMANLEVSQQKLDVQRKVVVEEFKETCLDEPYGDVMHHVGDMVYKQHPYRWPVIGLVPEHIEDAQLEAVDAFYKRYYHPKNAILTIAGNVNSAEVIERVNYWFGDIQSPERPSRNWAPEPPQEGYREKRITGDIPIPALILAFPMVDRNHPDYPATDLLSDVLAHGPSSRLHQRLVKNREIATQLDCYLSGTLENGLFFVEGRPAEGVSLDDLAKAIWYELEAVTNGAISDRELQKVKNKLESNFLFSEMSVLNKAINLAYYAELGRIEWINSEIQDYQGISAVDLQHVAQQVLRKENCSALFYEVAADATKNDEEE